MKKFFLLLSLLFFVGCLAARCDPDGTYDDDDDDIEESEACCFLSPNPGCRDERVEDCVCDVDWWCCSVNWDWICVGEVESEGCGTCKTKDPR